MKSHSAHHLSSYKRVVGLLFVLGLSLACNSTTVTPPMITNLGTSPTASSPTRAALSMAAGSTRTDSLGLLQVWVPAGCFKMGSDPAKDPQARADEQPAHEVCITHGFWLDQFDVTNAAFEAFVRAGGYSTDAYWSADGLKWKHSGNISGPDTDCQTLSSAPQQPRVCVKWYEAEAYANWRTQTANDGTVYRLPTEAEWEYAARGPQSLIFPWGNSFDSTRLNYCDKNCSDPWADTNANDGYAYTSPVNTYVNGTSWVNAYDMSGNIWQWVADWYSPDYYQNSPTYDPIGPMTGMTHVVRGGAWDSSPYALRAAFRNDVDTFRDLNIGFRVVGLLPPVSLRVPGKTGG